MRLTVGGDDGEPIEFDCPDTIASCWTCTSILEGETYPYLPFVEDVQVVFDIGANRGAASVHFGRHYPDAVVHAFEPGREARSYLERKVADLPNVVVHPIGLHSVDRAALLRDRGLDQPCRVAADREGVVRRDGHVFRAMRDCSPRSTPRIRRALDTR